MLAHARQAGHGKESCDPGRGYPLQQKDSSKTAFRSLNRVTAELWLCQNPKPFCNGDPVKPGLTLIKHYQTELTANSRAAGAQARANAGQAWPHEPGAERERGVPCGRAAAQSGAAKHFPATPRQSVVYILKGLT